VKSAFNHVAWIHFETIAIAYVLARKSRLEAVELPLQLFNCCVQPESLIQAIVDCRSGPDSSTIR